MSIRHDEHLRPLRQQIDAIDEKIISLLNQRFDVVKDVMKIKTEHGIPASLQDRVDQVHDRNVTFAEKFDMDPIFISKLYSFIIEYTCAHEANIMPHDDNSSERIPTKRRA